MALIQDIEETILDAESDDEGGAHLQNSDTEQAPDDILGPTSTWNWALGEKLPSLPRFGGQPGLKIDLNGQNSPSNYFDLFVDDAIIETIVAETNRYAAQALHGKTLPPSSHSREWTPVTLTEMRAFLGIIVAMGLVQQRNLTDYWCQDDVISTPFFRSVMSRNRFKLILQFLHLNNNELSLPRDNDEHDKLFKIRPFYDALLDKCGRMYIPDKNLALDEAMIAWRGNLSFKVYNPDKPDEFGVKVYEICDSGNGYCYQFEIYTGKQHQVSKHGATYDIVMRLMAPLLNQGYRLYIDNYYTSPILLQDLYYKKTVACGTLRSNRKGVPTVIKTTKLAKGDHMAMTLTGGNLQLIKWRDKRDVLILTSMHNAEFCDVPHGNRNGEAVRKPKAVLDYNKYMGAVDRSDQMLQYQAFKRKTLKWWKKVFFHLFNLAVLNAYIIYRAKVENADPQRVFRRKLAAQLVATHRGVRLNQAPASCTFGGDDYARLQGRHFPSKVPATHTRKYRTRLCVVCSSVTGKRKSAGDGRRRKETTFQCTPCDVGLCVTPCFELYHTEKDFQGAFLAYTSK